MTAIRLRYVTDNSIVSNLIRAGSYGFWATHVEAVTDEGKNLGAHYSGGVVARDPSYDASIWTKQLFVDIPCTAEQKDKFYAFLHSQLGKSYDLETIAAIGLSAFLGERNWRAPDSWICSELQMAAKEEAGIIRPLVTGVSHITPRDSLILVSAMVPTGEPESRKLVGAQI